MWGEVVKAKDFTAKVTEEKYKDLGLPNAGTGVHSPGSFGVSASSGAPSVSPRMAGGIGLQKLAAAVIHKGIDHFVMPAVENQMSKIVKNIKSDVQMKNHVANGGKVMSKSAVSM